MKLYFKSITFLFLFSLSFGCINTTKEVKNNHLVLNETKKMIPTWLKMNVEESLPQKGLNVWVPSSNFQTSSLVKVPRFPRKISIKELEKNPALKDFKIEKMDVNKALLLTAVKNEQVSAQISVAADVDIENLEVVFTDFKKEDGTVLEKEIIQTRFVKYLPVERARSEYVWSPELEEVIGEGVSGSMAPNVVGDALIETSTVNVPQYRAQPIWFTFKIPKTIKSGLFKGYVTLKTKQFKALKYMVSLIILDIHIPDDKAYQFHLDLWINPSSIAECYQIPHWSDAHWSLIKTYLKDYATRGGKNIATTITHEPWHKPWIKNTTISQSQFGYKSMVKWTKSATGIWHFDYSNFDTYVQMAFDLGISESINAYSLTPFRTKQKIHFYNENTKKDEILELDIGDADYKDIWSQFLKSFKLHLLEKGWFKKTYLGFDEKPDEVLNLLQEIIREAAPEFLDRIVVAGHPEATKYAQNLSLSYMFFPDQPLEKKATIPVGSIIENRNAENKTTTFYLCAEPSHPNTLSYSPAIEAQMIPWLALKYNTDGYLRWAYNNWTKDPFNQPVFIHNQGDDYYVYPGDAGPISTIRWELLKEGIEDYELFKVIQASGNVSDERLQKAVELATRSQDGRFKSVEDMVRARNLILNK